MSHARSLIRTRRTGLAAVAAACSALVFAGPALGAEATLVSGTLTVQDAPGRSSAFSVGELANPLSLPALDQVVVDTDRPLSAPDGCTHPTLLILADPTAVLCPRSIVKTVSMDLGDGDDTVLRPLALNVLGTRATAFGTLAVELDGGAGADLLQGGDGPDVLAGGSGDDTLLGFGGDDTLVGGLGLDRVEPGEGRNSVDVSTPEVDTVAFSADSANTASASANDIFLGAVETAKITIVGASDAGDSATVASASVQADPNSLVGEAGVPSVEDLVKGVTSVVPGGTVPDGVTLPVQPLLGSLVGIAGKLGVQVRLGADLDVSLPLGVTLDDAGLHIEVGCTSRCEISGSGVVDGGSGVATLTPDTVTIAGTQTSRLNLGVGTEYTKFARPLQAGRCAVVVTRLRVRTTRGSEVVSYALPACGTKLTFEPARQPVVTDRRATRRLVATAQCSSDCSLTPRFLLVKSGNKVLARTTAMAVRQGRVKTSGREHTTIWKLSAAQEAAITRAHRKGLTKLRYIVSATATSGGVSTTGTASFRTRGT